MNTAIAAAKSLLAPKRALAHPAVGTKATIATMYTVTMEVSASVGCPKLLAMAGSDVVTIVLSSVSMKNAAATMSGMRREKASAWPSATTGDCTARF